MPHITPRDPDYQLSHPSANLILVVILRPLREVPDLANSESSFDFLGLVECTWLRHVILIGHLGLVPIVIRMLLKRL